MTQPPTCHHHPDLGWLTPEHRAACADPDCHGCRPCGEDHCELNGRCGEHVDHDAGIYTCPRCIRKVKREVRAIVDCYALVDTDVELRGFDLAPLLDEAGESGIDSEAFNLIGPAADPGQYTEKRARLRTAYERRGWCDWPRHEGFREDDRHHPYAVLGRWDMAMRESYGPPTDLFVTVSRAADYLTGPLLDRFAHTQEFVEFAREISHCLHHLEAVLHDSREPDKGAPCPTCREQRPGEKAPRLRKRYGAATDGRDDTWHCPAVPAHWWSHVDYRARVDGDYLEHATALTASQIHEAHGIKPGTLRQWASRGAVSRRGRNDQGQQLYDVAQAVEARGDSDTQDALA